MPRQLDDAVAAVGTRRILYHPRPARQRATGVQQAPRGRRIHAQHRRLGRIHLVRQSEHRRRRPHDFLRPASHAAERNGPLPGVQRGDIRRHFHNLAHPLDARHCGQHGLLPVSAFHVVEVRGIHRREHHPQPHMAWRQLRRGPFAQLGDSGRIAGAFDDDLLHVMAGMVSHAGPAAWCRRTRATRRR